MECVFFLVFFFQIAIHSQNQPPRCLKFNYGYLWERPERLHSHPPPRFLFNRIREVHFYQYLLHLSVFRLHHHCAVQSSTDLCDCVQSHFTLGQIHGRLQPGRHRCGAEFLHHPWDDQVVPGQRQLHHLRRVPGADVHLLHLYVARVICVGHSRLRPLDRYLLPYAPALHQHAAQHVVRGGSHVVVHDRFHAVRHCDHQKTVLL